MPNSSLKTQISEDMKTAMRAKDSRRLAVIRMLMAAIKQREIDERITLEETQVLAVIDKMLKQRQDSIKQFQAAGRQDLVDQESFEVEVLTAYLPQPLTAEEIDQLIDNAISQTAATSMQDMGKVMAIIKPEAQGRANIGTISAQVKARLTSQ